MALMYPLIKYKNLERSGNLRAYFRANVDLAQTGYMDLGIPTNAYAFNTLSLTAVDGTPTWKYAIGKALTSEDPRFVGEGVLAITLANFTYLLSSATTTFTICIRFLCIATTGYPQVIFCNGVWGVDGYSISFDNDANLNLFFNDHNSSSPTSYTISDTPLSTGVWYTVCISVFSTTNMMVFIDGVQQNSFISPITALTTPTSTTYWFNMDKLFPTTLSFYGKIAEFIFYDSQLPSSLLQNCFPSAPFG